MRARKRRKIARAKTRPPTEHQNLYRHKTGVYYARLSLGGKET